MYFVKSIKLVFALDACAIEIGTWDPPHANDEQIVGIADQQDPEIPTASH